MNVCGAVQYIDTAAADLQMIERVLYQDIRIFYLFIKYFIYLSIAKRRPKIKD